MGLGAQLDGGYLWVSCDRCNEGRNLSMMGAHIEREGLAGRIALNRVMRNGFVPTKVMREGALVDVWLCTSCMKRAEAIAASLADDDKPTDMCRCGHSRERHFGTADPMCSMRGCTCTWLYVYVVPS